MARVGVTNMASYMRGVTQGINPVGDNAQVNEHLHKQSNKLAPNAIKGLSIPSWLLAKVRSDGDR